MSDPNERQALDDLLRSDGWRLFERAVSDYWTTHLTQHVAACANEKDDVTALQLLRQVVAAKKAVDQMLAWPKERLRQTQPTPEFAASHYRGGYGA